MDSPDPILLAAKARRRSQMRARRRALVESREALSSRAADLAPLERWSDVRVVAGYLAMETEIDPAPLLRRFVALGAQVALPVVVDRSGPLIFRAAVPPRACVPDAAGLAAPPVTAPIVTPDLIIAPLVAFDRLGGRLGQGGGYYDRTLRGLRAAGRVRVVGLAFSAQEVDAVPVGPFDERLDAILTEIEYVAV